MSIQTTLASLIEKDDTIPDTPTFHSPCEVRPVQRAPQEVEKKIISLDCLMTKIIEDTASRLEERLEKKIGDILGNHSKEAVSLSTIQVQLNLILRQMDKLERQSEQHSDRQLEYPSKRPLEYPSKRPLEYPSERQLEYPSERQLEYPSERQLEYPSDGQLAYPRASFRESTLAGTLGGHGNN